MSSSSSSSSAAVPVATAGDHALAWHWIALNGCLDAKALVAVVCRTSRSLSELLHTEAFWRHTFLRRYLDRRPQICSAEAQGYASAAARGELLWSDAKSWMARWRMRQAYPGVLGKVLAERRPEWEAGVVFAGAPRSGKSWLVHRICHGVVPSRVDKATILGTDLSVTSIQLLGESSVGRIRLWEPSGASRKDSVLENYFRKADAIVILIDASEHVSPPEVVADMLRKAARVSRATSSLTLCCTKAERLGRAHSKHIQALQRLATEVRAEFTTCSAVTGDGVLELMCQVLSACREAGGYSPRTTPVLSTEAGTLSNSELLSALLLHRR